jgi:hypothetical protein
MNMDSAVKPPQPSRLLQVLQPWIVKVYRVAGMVALGAILVGLIVFLTGTIFWYFNRTWVRPVILSPEHVKVSAATNALHDAQARLSDTTFKLLVAHDELARLDPKLARDDKWLADFTAAGHPSLQDRAVADDRQTERDAALDRKRELDAEIKELETQRADYEKEAAREAASPYIRATEEKRVVGFVPYQNLSNIHPGVTLYACEWGLVRCHSAGKVLSILEGEVQDVHPHDDSVQRGVMVEIDLSDDPDAAQQNVLFAGSKPFWWL